MVLKEKLPTIGRALSIILLIGTVAVIVTAFIRARKQPRPPIATRAESYLKPDVTSVVEGYKYVKTDKGRETLRLLAAKDTTFADGRHELEKVDLTSFDEKPGKNIRITADRGSWVPEPGVVTFTGNVRLTSSDGLEVASETIKYEKQNDVASTDVAIQFRQGEISGSSTGAQLYGKTRNLSLLKDAHLVTVNPDLNKKGEAPVEIRGDKANYAEFDGVIRFEGNASVTQAERSARADTISGVINTKTKKLDRIEMRGNSMLKSQEKGNASEMTARDLDFFFDEAQQLKSATANGSAIARSLEKDSPREISAEKIDALYRPARQGEKGTFPQAINTQGRTKMKIVVEEGAPNAKEVTEREVEADSVQATFQQDGKHLAQAEATGNALLTVTPKKITPTAEKKKLRAAKFNAEFFETGNSIKSFVADGNAVAEFERMQPLPKEIAQNAKQDAKKETKDSRAEKPAKKTASEKKTLSGKKMTANFHEQTQDISELIVDGDAKLNDGDRNATAARATYTASNQMVAMRGKPLLWDSSARANADEIDIKLDSGESELRNRVRTIYYSRETTGGAAPFKKNKAPVTIVADRATFKHNEEAALYVGNVRAWQDNDFIRADNMELDNGERVMTAWGNAQSAFYDFEREVEKNKKKEVVPVFAQAVKMTYRDETRTAHYEGGVKIRQGTDLIDALVADAVMDEENKLVRLTASNDVVMTQPGRRATGDQVVYTAANDTAVLTGDLAMVEDRDRDAVTKSSKLTLHLRDARIEANGESGSKKRVKTTHRIQN